MASRERIVEFIPAYDKRHTDPAKNYGIGGVKIRFLLKGPEGAVQFLMGTGWYLPHVAKELRERNRDPDGIRIFFEPKGWDVGYHSPTPRYEGQERMGEPGECPLVPPGSPCYYDGSGLAAEPVLDRLIHFGHEAVWLALETRYDELFGEESPEGATKVQPTAQNDGAPAAEGSGAPISSADQSNTYEEER